MSTKNFYDTKIRKIKHLIQKDQLEQALKLLEEELRMLYIPLQYEKIFNQLLLEVTSKMQLSLNNPYVINLEQFVEALTSRNDLQLTLAINSMQELNLQRIALKIKDWIEDENYDYPIAKVYMMEQLAEQNVDLVICYNGKKINPKKFGSIFSKEQVMRVFYEIKKFTDKQPFLTNLVFQNFKAYLLTNYPRVRFPQLISKNLVKITEYLFDKTIKLNKREQLILKQVNSLSK